MKKLIITLSALAAVGAGSAAFAQSGSAECQAGTARTLPAECLSSAQQRQIHGYSVARPGDNVAPGTVIAGPATIFLPGLSSYAQRYSYVSPYERTRGDRDGDGVRNRRDRYPDDPRYR